MIRSAMNVSILLPARVKSSWMVSGSYMAVKRTVREIRPEPIRPFEVRLETPPDAQPQVDLAHFMVVFADEPGVIRIVRMRRLF
jgi:hypothetical protein